MNSDELRDWYLALTDSDKQVFLALVSHHLTIHGRCFGLDLTGDEQIKAFEGLNEIQHKISSQIAGIGMMRARYPDELLLNILNEMAAAYGLLAHLKQSFTFARTSSYWVESK